MNVNKMQDALSHIGKDVFSWLRDDKATLLQMCLVCNWMHRLAKPYAYLDLDLNEAHHSENMVQALSLVVQSEHMPEGALATAQTFQLQKHSLRISHTLSVVKELTINMHPPLFRDDQYFFFMPKNWGHQPSSNTGPRDQPHGLEPVEVLLSPSAMSYSYGTSPTRDSWDRHVHSPGPLEDSSQPSRSSTPAIGSDSPRTHETHESPILDSWHEDVFQSPTPSERFSRSHNSSPPLSDSDSDRKISRMPGSRWQIRIPRLYSGVAEPESSYPFDVLEAARLNAKMTPGATSDATDDMDSDMNVETQAATGEAGDSEDDELNRAQAGVWQKLREIMELLHWLQSSVREKHAKPSNGQALRDNAGLALWPPLPFSSLTSVTLKGINFPAVGLLQFTSGRSPLSSVTNLSIWFRLSNEISWVWEANMLELAGTMPNIEVLMLYLEDDSTLEEEYEEWLSYIPHFGLLREVQLQLSGSYRRSEDPTMEADFCEEWSLSYLEPLVRSFVDTSVLRTRSSAFMEAGAEGTPEDTELQVSCAGFEKLVLHLPALDYMEWSCAVSSLVEGLHKQQLLQYGSIIVSVETQHAAS